jgi:peptidyl-prolyl cis-trans isomerase B (cyclophilin B)
MFGEITMKRLNRAIAALAVFAAVLFVLSGCKKSEDKIKVKMDVRDYGTIYLELYPDEAPITVANFVKLANEHFYDGLTFHRIISGFMIQGGDPEHNGMGGSDENIKGEFKLNGVENNISHIRGTISMGRTQFDYNSASSQFFIVHKDSTGLDGQYAAFGRVTEGIEVVDKICESVPVVDNNGTVLFENQPVITSVEIID